MQLFTLIIGIMSPVGGRVGGEGRKFRGSFELAGTGHVLTDSKADAQIVPREHPVLPVLP